MNERLKKPIVFKCAFLFLMFSALASCNSNKSWKSENYELYSIDSPQDLELGYKLGDGAFVKRVRAKIIAIGENENWITVAREPKGNTSQTEYYYISKAKDGRHKNISDVVTGPLSKAEFDVKKRTFTLPAFSKEFK